VQFLPSLKVLCFIALIIMNQEEIIAKIRKVLALAKKAGTDGEKAAALEAAKRLAKANGIDLDEVDDTVVDPSVSMADGEATSVDENGGEEMRLSMAIIRQHFGVCMAVSEIGAGRRMKRRMLWFGSRLNIGVAQWVYHILMRESRKAWESVKDMGLKRDLFMHGWFSRIHEILTAHPIRNDLDVLEAERKAAEKQMEKFAEEQKDAQKKLRKGKGNDIDGNSVIEGYDRAKSVVLNRPVDGTETTKKSELKQEDTRELFYHGRSMRAVV